MKTFILSSFILIGLSVFGFIIYMLPYHYYITAVSEGIEGELLNIERSPAHFMSGTNYQVERNLPSLSEDDSRWEIFHFSHFEVPVPIYHHIYVLRPEIEYDDIDDSLLFGFSFMNHRSEVFAKFVVHEPFHFRMDLGSDQLFNLPYLKNYILSKSSREIWKDLFIKDLLISDEQTFFEKYNTIRKYPLRELVYNLYLLRNRNQFFGYDFDEIQYYGDKDIGVLSSYALAENDQFDRDILFVLDRGIVYPVELQVLRYSPEGEAFRKRLLNNLNYRPTNQDASIPIYSRYRQLEFSQRSGHEGMIYLYMAWSHVPEQKEFLREMIRFLERGELKEMFIEPLYDFAFKKYGTTFSHRELRESAEQRLQRKMQQELEEEIYRESQKHLIIPGERFESIEKRMEFLLQRAKDKGLDRSIERNILRMD